MRSSPISRSPSPSSRGTAPRRAAALGLLLAAAAALPGCGGDDCGTGGAPATGLTASSAEVELTYGDLTSLAGNDCPAMDAPAGVVSLSIEGRTADGTGLVTLCVPRPDLLMDGERTLGAPRTSADVWIEDLNGMVDGCTYAFDDARPPLGGLTATGVCGNGVDPAGFALEVDASLSLLRTCGATTDQITVALAGRVAVTERPQ